MARPSEITAVAEVLMDPADDVREVAKACIAALDASRTDRVDYLVVRQSGWADAYGPYPTYKAAATAIEKGKIPALDGSRLFIVPLRHPTQADRAFERADESNISEEARKMWEVARNGGQRAKTHSRRNRRAVA